VASCAAALTESGCNQTSASVRCLQQHISRSGIAPGRQCQLDLSKLKVQQLSWRQSMYSRVRNETRVAKLVCNKSAQRLCGVSEHAPGIDIMACICKHMQKWGKTKLDPPCLSFMRQTLQSHISTVSVHKAPPKWLSTLFMTAKELEARKKFDAHRDLVEPGPDEDDSKDSSSQTNITDDDNSSELFSDDELDEMVERSMVKAELSDLFKNVQNSKHKTKSRSSQSLVHPKSKTHSSITRLPPNEQHDPSVRFGKASGHNDARSSDEASAVTHSPKVLFRVFMYTLGISAGALLLSVGVALCQRQQDIDVGTGLYSL